MGSLCQLHLPDIGVVEHTIDEEPPQRLVLAGYLQKHVCFDGLQLCVAHHTPLHNILQQFLDGAFVRRQPFITFLFNQFIKHCICLSLIDWEDFGFKEKLTHEICGRVCELLRWFQIPVDDVPHFLHEHFRRLAFVIIRADGFVNLERECAAAH